MANGKDRAMTTAVDLKWSRELLKAELEDQASSTPMIAEIAIRPRNTSA
jgi:hypothetical protein